MFIYTMLWDNLLDYLVADPLSFSLCDHLLLHFQATTERRDTNGMGNAALHLCPLLTRLAL